MIFFFVVEREKEKKTPKKNPEKNPEKKSQLLKNPTPPPSLTVASGVVPMPSPVPWYITHMPHAAPLANCASLSAMVLEMPFVQGRPLVLAKFSEKEQAPWASWPSSWP